ncbi:Mu transposase C-terminal domain-containing protein [Microbacterium sp.]|uniref:Mu transposase C-terminal domain-containing protein n=1 Tax=Microbacterium sp. TaxID=51671 RepID=UPI0037363CA8
MTWLAEGALVSYDGEACRVVELLADAVVLVDSRGGARRVRLVELLTPPEEGGLIQLPAESDERERGARPVLDGMLWRTASSKAREAAQRAAGDAREVETGYRSGAAEFAEPGEPRPEYDPATTNLTKRKHAKASERGVSVRTVETWIYTLRRSGMTALLDGRSGRDGTLLQNVDPDWLSTCEQVLAELTDRAKLRKTVVATWIEDRVKQRTERGDFGGRIVRAPKATTRNEVFDELDRGRGLFKGSTGRRRSNASRPTPPYGRLRASRPGEVLILDTTRFNVFGLDALGRWDSVELTAAMDLSSRTIRGLRMTPRSTKAIDVTGVLFEAMQPFVPPSEWSAEAAWPYSGLPDTLVVATERIRLDQYWTSADEAERKRQLAAAKAREAERREAVLAGADDGMLPETIVVDHGKVYLSETAISFCANQGISVQPARIAMGSDKGPLERFFGTTEQLLQEVPGYKGRSIDTRGLRPEDEAVYTVQQLEQIVREWVATVYHHTPHSSLFDPHLPGVLLSPVQAHARGIALAGRLRLPQGRNLLLEMLPVEMRNFRPTGIEMHGLTYTGPILEKYLNRSRVISSGRRSWPFRYDPDDLSRIYFHDPENGSWHTLTWVRHADLDMPFSMDALEYAKRHAVSRGGKKDVEGALVELLRRLGISRGDTAREKLIAAREVARRDPVLPLNQPTSLATVQRLLTAFNAARTSGEGAALSQVPAIAIDLSSADEILPASVVEPASRKADGSEDGFYDDVMEIL